MVLLYFEHAQNFAEIDHLDSASFFADSSNKMMLILAAHNQRILIFDISLDNKLETDGFKFGQTDKRVIICYFEKTFVAEG